MVPVVSPHTALGIAVGQEIHDQTSGSSPATVMARTSRYFLFSPSAGNLFQSLQDDCFKCRHIRMIRDSIVPGLSLQLNVACPFLVFTKSKQSAQETRQEKRVKRKNNQNVAHLSYQLFHFKIRRVAAGRYDNGSFVFSYPRHHHLHRIFYLSHIY